MVKVANETGQGEMVVLLIVAALAIVVGAAVATYLARRHRGVRWLKTHVTVAPRLGAGASLQTRPIDDDSRDHLLTVVAAEIGCSTTVEEKKP